MREGVGGGVHVLDREEHAAAFSWVVSALAQEPAREQRMDREL
jgi:hypothetical protein